MRKQKYWHGQSLMEFALLFPIAILLLVGFFDLGRAIFYYSSISNMVREGARFGITDTNAKTSLYADNIDEINKFSFGIPDVNKAPKDSDGNDASGCYPGPCYYYSSDDNLVVMIDRLTEAEFFVDSTMNNTENAYIQIEGTFNFEPVTPFIERIFGNSTGIDLVAKSTMRISGNARD